MTRVNEEQLFNKGEKVLCYEPDKSKAKVLYDSKILAVYTRKDDSNLVYYDYKIHFQGWNSSWDRNVRATSLLKDNDTNRKLQRELAEAAQLQKIGGYSYKDTKTPTPSTSANRSRDSSGNRSRDNTGNRSRNSSGNRSRDNSAGRKSQIEKPSTSDAAMKEARKSGRADGEKKPVKSQFGLLAGKVPEKEPDEDKLVVQEDRVMLRISERLREYMEYDYNMITKYGKLHKTPARMPIVTILENFVKQRAVELALNIKQDSSRARNTQRRNARMEREYDRVMSNVCMLKEVVDGLRIYFEFHLEDHLLYEEEKEHVYNALPHDLNICRALIHKAHEKEIDMLSATNGVEIILGDVEHDKKLHECLAYIVKAAGKNGLAHAYDQRTSPYQAAYKLSLEMRGFICETFNWRLLCSESPPEKSMIFGAPHLARLLIKLPEYLNASPMANKKMEDLLTHLDPFINYLENHKSWFDKEVYEVATEEEA